MGHGAVTTSRTVHIKAALFNNAVYICMVRDVVTDHDPYLKDLKICNVTGSSEQALNKSSSGMKSGVEDRKVLWSGTVTVAELVRHRVVDTNVRRIYPTIEIHMQPHPNRQENGVAVLQVVTRLKRFLRPDSVWRRIYNRVRNTLSKSFRRRQMDLSRRLHTRFHEKMDAMLMTRATSVLNDFKTDFVADKDLATSPLNERNARHASHAHSSGYQHHSHTYVHKSAKPPVVVQLIPKGFHLSFSEKPVAALRDEASSTPSCVDSDTFEVSADSWRLDVGTRLEDLKETMKQLMEQQQNQGYDLSALRSECHPMVQWSNVNTSVASEVAELRSDMCEMARSQGAIMTALQEQSQQLQQVMGATQKLLARAPATPPHPEARAHANSHSPLQQKQHSPSLNANEAQQRSPSLNATEMFPPLVARRLVADMSSVHKVVNGEIMRSHDVQSAGRHCAHAHKYIHMHTRNRGDGESERRTPRGIGPPKVSDMQTHAQLEEVESESESEREQEERVSWTSKRPSINDLKQARLVRDLTPLVENKAQSAISSPAVSGAQHTQEHDLVETPVSSSSDFDFGSFLFLSPTVDQDVCRRGGAVHSTPFTSYSTRSRVPLSPRTKTPGSNASTRPPSVPPLPLTISAWHQAKENAPTGTPRSNRISAKERFPLHLELQCSRSEARDQVYRV